MPDGVAKVDEVAQACLALVDGDDVCFDRDGTDDDAEEDVLRRGTGGAGSS